MKISLLKRMLLPIFCFSMMLAPAFAQTTKAPSIIFTSEMLEKKFNCKKDQRFLLVSIDNQEMYVIKNDSVEKTYRISTSKYGVGSKAGSNKTPLGVHRIAEKIGKDAKLNTIFVGRKDSGKLAAIIKDPVDVEADNITTRILWLDGLEPGINRGKGIDSHSRFIYIHGTPEEGLIGIPASHGCIRMYNNDVMELFDLVKVGTLVVIAEGIKN